MTTEQLPCVGWRGALLLQLPFVVALFTSSIAGWVHYRVALRAEPRVDVHSVRARIHDERGQYVPYDALPIALTMAIVATMDPTLRQRTSWVEVPLQALHALHALQTHRTLPTGRVVLAKTVGDGIFPDGETRHCRSLRCQWERVLTTWMVEARFDDDTLVELVANDHAAFWADRISARPASSAPLRDLSLWEAAEVVVAVRSGSGWRRRPEAAWYVLTRLAETPAEQLVRPHRVSEAEATQVEVRRLLSGEVPIDACL